MKRFFLILCVLLAAVFIGVNIRHSTGYVLIATHHFFVEASLWAGLIIVVFSFIIFYLFIRLLKFIFNLPAHVKGLKQKARKNEATKVTYEGLMDLMQANWSTAYEKLMSGKEYSPAPLVNYLGSAFAADRDALYQQRDRLLTQASEEFPKANLAVNLVRSQLQFEAGEYQGALQTLNGLQSFSSKQKQVLKQRVRVLKKLGAWRELIEILPEVKKQNSLRMEELQKYAGLAYHHVFEEMENVEQLKKIWSDAPKFITAQAEVVCLYVKALIKQQAFSNAEAVVCEFFKKNWDANLVLLYADILSENAKQQFSMAEGWLKQHPNDENLLFTLGKLAQRNRLWGKAKDYYRASIAQKPTAYAYAACAQLLEQLDEQAESLKLYRKGLLLSIGN